MISVLPFYSLAKILNNSDTPKSFARNVNRVLSECLGRLIRTSSTARPDASHQPKECFFTPLRKHPDGGWKCLRQL